MARIHQRAASSRPGRARSKVTGHRRRPYKVILESISQEKKRLYTVISFEAEAPPGYTFIPAGNPRLTNRCKELSREHGVKVLIVSTTPHKNHKSTLSHQVHRIGHHFPSWILGQACMDLGLHVSSSGHVIRRHDGGAYSALGPIRSRVLNSENERKASPRSDVSQAALNAEARDAIKDLFPKIPETDLNKIISRAFQKGKSRVGTASELSLPRRVQLAVVAHIRHVYTNYDRLLRTGTYHAARAQIEQKCLDQLVQWRGDGEDGTNDMEEILREVIVISDDEDDEADRISNSALVGRDSSVEIISSHALANDVHVRPMDYRDEVVAVDDEQPYALEYLAPGIVQRVEQKYQGDEQRAKERFGRRGFGRYRAWDQALDRYRKNPTHYSDPVNDVPIDHGNEANKLRNHVYQNRPLQGVSESGTNRKSNEQYERYGERIITYAEKSRPPTREWLHDPRQSFPQYLDPPSQSSGPARESGYLALRPQPRILHDGAYDRSAAKPDDFIDISSGHRLPQAAISSYLPRQELVLPSIEGSSHHLTSPTSRRTDEGFETVLNTQRSGSYAAQQQMSISTIPGYTPVMPRLIEFDEHDDVHLTKRPRITHPAYIRSNDMAPVTSRALLSEASGSGPNRVQRPAGLDRAQTATGFAHHRRPLLRSPELVYTDLPQQDTWTGVSER
ncbi:MAG: hypothetical protein M1830_008524, partial [Pleopsidium flavum]